MNITPADPAEQWGHLLNGLSVSVREAVLASLRHSADSGWPATTDSVQLLVAYAEGRIDSRTYAAETLRVLGLDRPAPAPTHQTAPEPSTYQRPYVEPAAPSAYDTGAPERVSTYASSYVAADSSFPDYSRDYTASYEPPLPPAAPRPDYGAAYDSLFTPRQEAPAPPAPLRRSYDTGRQSRYDTGRQPRFEPASSYAAEYSATPDMGLPQYAPEPSRSPVPPPKPHEVSRESAVQAYVNGRISVEEFLRVSGSRHQR